MGYRRIETMLSHKKMCWIKSEKSAELVTVNGLRCQITQMFLVKILHKTWRMIALTVLNRHQQGFWSHSANCLGIADDKSILLARRKHFSAFDGVHNEDILTPMPMSNRTARN